DIYDFTHYLLMVNREPNENNQTLNRLIQAVKDMQKENEKGIKEVSKKSAEETKKGIKRDYSDTDLSTNQIKELLNNAKIPTSGRDAITFGTNNLNPEIVEFLHKNNKKMIIEKASNKELELLADANFRHPENIRVSLDHDAIAHILKRHGVNSVNVKNGEIPITNEDIANYRSFIDGADGIFVDNNNLIAFKQINGYAVVVEQAVNRKSELVLKTIYKSNGDYKDNNAYKKLQDTKPSKGQP
uniref:PBECR3 domain-containing polyvalent protein n=1 Tax=Helicobacter pylori TaxID=210 RepID=UPI000EACF6AA